MDWRQFVMDLEKLNPDRVEEIFALIELAEPIAGHAKSGCLLALSGILSEQVEDVLAAYRPWIAFDAPVSREQSGQTWARPTGRRIEG